MQLQDVNTFVLCQMFPSTVIGFTQKWYQHLIPSLIQNFTQFATLFKYRFITCIPLKKFSSDLLKIRQEEGESLRSFISRFNVEVIQVEKLNHEIACKALKKRIHNVKRGIFFICCVLQ